jgi:Ser/Thr protein kinase RdoA (MazF antagonist)
MTAGRTIMNAGEITDILIDYDVGSLRHADPFDFDPRRPWKITTDAGCFVVRECFLNARAADLEFEHGLALWLTRYGFPVSRPISTRGGRTWSERNDRFFAIYTLIPGEPFSPGHAVQAQNAGAALARFHDTASSFPEANRRTPPQGYRSTYDHAEYLIGTRGDRSEVKRLVTVYRELDRSLGSRTLDECLLFNDFQPGNVLFLQEEFSGAFDLDCCFWGPRLLDVAKSLLAFALTLEGEPEVPAQPVFSLASGQAFLCGYLDHRHVPSEELAVLPTALKREARALALFDLSDVEKHSHRWVQDEWLLAKSQMDLADANADLLTDANA